jgi:hypothetical protein
MGETYGSIFNNRLLSQRARLEFHYGGGTENGEDIIVFIPFYENPTITESQSANYAEYNPVGRAGTLYAYTGSKSRKLKVKTTFTLPHLSMHDMGIDKFMRVFKGASKESQKLLFTQFAKYSPKQKASDPNNSLSLAVEKMYWQLRAEQGDDLASLVPDGNTTIPVDVQAVIQGMEQTEKQKVIDTLLFFVAILRTSVVNKAVNPMHGPPLVRLNFGTMYQSIPCICKSFNISWDDSAGFDVETLTPRRLTVALTLEEVRVGDFATYEPAAYVQRDNLTGWESAIGSPYTIDPLNIGSFGKSG